MPNSMQPALPSLLLLFILSITQCFIGAASRERGKGEEGGGRGRVPGRTGRRARCCRFAEVLGFSRAELSGTKIGFRDFKMTAWSFRTSLAK